MESLSISGQQSEIDAEAVQKLLKEKQEQAPRLQNGRRGGLIVNNIDLEQMKKQLISDNVDNLLQQQ